MFTDCGVFLSGTSYIKPPYNDKVPSYLNLPLAFSITMWVLPQNSEGNLMHKSYNWNNYFFMHFRFFGDFVERISIIKKIASI